MLQERAIVEAALQLLKAGGLDGVTFRKLIERLHVKAPAIYWRFESKRDLLDAMAEAILHERFANLQPKPPSEASGPWLRASLHRLRDAMLAYPDGARLIAGARPDRTPTLARIADYALQAMEREAGDLQVAAGIVFTALHFTFGHVIEEQSSPKPAELAGAMAAPMMTEFPTIARLIRTYDRRSWTPEAVYDFGVSLILSGGERLPKARPARQGTRRRDGRPPRRNTSNG